MAKYFEVKFCVYWGDDMAEANFQITEETSGKMPYDSDFLRLGFAAPILETLSQGEEVKKEINQKWKREQIFKKFYVHPVSYEIFEHKENDANICFDLNDENKRHIIRDGKYLFRPKEEMEIK